MKEYIVQIREGVKADGWTIIYALEKVLPPESCEVFSRSAAQHRMHQTAFGVLALVFFLGFGIGAVVFNGLCGGW